MKVTDEMIMNNYNEYLLSHSLKDDLDSGKHVRIYLKDDACCNSVMREEFEKNGYLTAYKRDSYYVVMCEGCTLSIGLFRDVSELDSIISMYELC